ncbi:hypothetical protein N5I27_07390 [Acinetobacter johnsonii]|uniref:Uncharacterized protein n=1 Tax=Acinetobacter johnsonii TaxID=40214 RepID=A0AA42QRX3_ACIJO|nr:hypothetical protein [Acinetobacter johnsonii]MDH1365877.1 hypothetical protein [Acinetobacter johnsonii]MDH1438216.1 hypothetical protein [Acinetobacter johnsonii]HAK17234.1 hypothetical protein [Acinetobacter junii]
MKIKVYSLLSIGIFMGQSTQAKRFIKGLHGALKLNPNMYAFGADEDNTIGQKNLNFFADWKTTATSQEKHALSLPIALNTRLDQTSYRVYNQAYLSPETTQLNAIQNKSQNRLSLF